MPVARRDYDDDDGQPWHNRTSTLLGASVLAILVITILIVAATALARQFDEPEQAPLDFVAPTYSATNSESAAASTTTQTITSTSPPDDHRHRRAFLVIDVIDYFEQQRDVYD